MEGQHHLYEISQTDRKHWRIIHCLSLHYNIIKAILLCTALHYTVLLKSIALWSHYFIGSHKRTAHYSAVKTTFNVYCCVNWQLIIRNLVRHGLGLSV